VAVKNVRNALDVVDDDKDSRPNQDGEEVYDDEVSRKINSVTKDANSVTKDANSVTLNP
jgi:hypothetical protein